VTTQPRLAIRSLAALVVLASVPLLGCSHAGATRNAAPALAQPAGADDELPPPRFPDPLEPLNRSISALNHAAIVVVADPVGRVYRLVIPRWVRERVRSFSGNLLFPRNLVANLLQGRVAGARQETIRFAINTTLGIAGFFDRARAWGYEAAEEDFGQVFATWGWRPSTYLVLPIVGPSTIRDALGLVPDSLLDPSFYYFPAGPILAWNEQVDSIEDYERFVATSFDAYDDAHLVWTLSRDERIEERFARGEDTGPVQSLQSVLLAPRDPDFAQTLCTGHAQIPSTGRKLAYSYRLQRVPAPLVFVAPGFGGHRLSQSSTALAELAWERGFSVVVVSSTMSREFMLDAASGSVPGHGPADARDLWVALDAVDRDLAKRHREHASARLLLAYSLGAFHAFFIAAWQQGGTGDLVPFDGFLTLDAPVRLRPALRELDAFYRAPMLLPPERREEEVVRILRKAAAVARQVLEAGGRREYSRVDSTDLGKGRLLVEGELPFSDHEARYLIGLSFRRMLQGVLWTSQRREDLGVLRTPLEPLRRGPAYREIGDISFDEYLRDFVLPYYRDRRGLVDSEQDLERQNDLHELEAALRASGRIRHFANSNDFLTSDADEAWLVDVLGAERTRFFPSGGHLGNLHREEVQREIQDVLEALAREAARTPVATHTRRQRASSGTNRADLRHVVALDLHLLHSEARDCGLEARHVRSLEVGAERRLGLPLLEDVEEPLVLDVGREGVGDAAALAARIAHQVARGADRDLAFGRVETDVSGDDEHGGLRAGGNAQSRSRRASGASPS
jgi:ABC-type transporter lipoprotein component MlaA